MKEKLLIRLARLAEKHSWAMFIGALVLTLVLGAMSENLELNMNFKDLMPQSHPTVQEYDKIVNNYSAASNIIIGAMGEENDLKAFTDEIAPKIVALKEYVSKVDYKINRDFFEKHAFMLTKEKDLKNSKDMYKDLSLVPLFTEINNSFEKTYIAEGEESISTKEKENKAIASLDGIENWLESMNSYINNGGNKNSSVENAVDKMLIGEEYMLSFDKNMILLFVKPTFPTDKLDTAAILINKIENIISETKTNYPSITMAGTAGTMSLAVQETEAASSDMSFTSIISFFLIIALFIISFRMWSAPLLAGVSLIMGVIWTMGFATLTIGHLNMMTSMFAVILIGLGIDFNIHVIAGYNENRANGNSILGSIENAFLKSGNGIIVGAVTTALAFLTMLVSRNSGMKEFALIAGVGVLLTMLASLLALPSMLILHDKIKMKKAQKANEKLDILDQKDKKYQKLKNKTQKLQKTKTTKFRFMGNVAASVSRKPMLVLSAIVAITVVLVYAAAQITFNYNYLSLEPEGLSCIAVQDSMIEHFDATPDMVMVTTSDIKHARELTEKAKELRKTGMVTSISEFIPSEKDYRNRVPYINEIRDNLKNYKFEPGFTKTDQDLLSDELYRLEDNLIELGQLAFMGGQDRLDKKVKEIVGDLEQDAATRKSLINQVVKTMDENPESATLLFSYEEIYVPVFKEKSLKMTSDERIILDNLPNDIKDQFISHDGNHFLVTIFPKEQAWDFEFLRLFSDQMHKIDERVTGMPLVFYILITYIGKDGAIAAILTLFVVFFLLLADFKNIKLTLLTMVPLLIGVTWMVGLMKVFGMQLNILNVMAVPLILGIGIDDGVHIIHRYKIEGKNKIRLIFSSTGKAVLITTITTFLAFGSLGFASARGLASLGVTLAIGIITCFLSTVVVLPAIFGVIDNKK